MLLVVSVYLFVCYGLLVFVMCGSCCLCFGYLCLLDLGCVCFFVLFLGGGVLDCLIDDVCCVVVDLDLLCRGTMCFCLCC